jgi:hypothetical protein
VLSELIERVRGTPGRGALAAAERRRASIDAAVAWWVASLGEHGDVDQSTLDVFGSALTRELAEQLDKTYRVYLEVNHQPTGILRAAALASGVGVASFPSATTMSVSDTKVAVSKAALEPYVVLHGR